MLLIKTIWKKNKKKKSIKGIENPNLCFYFLKTKKKKKKKKKLIIK